LQTKTIAGKNISAGRNIFIQGRVNVFKKRSKVNTSFVLKKKATVFNGLIK